MSLSYLTIHLHCGATQLSTPIFDLTFFHFLTGACLARVPSSCKMYVSIRVHTSIEQRGNGASAHGGCCTGSGACRLPSVAPTHRGNHCHPHTDTHHCRCGALSPPARRRCLSSSSSARIRFAVAAPIHRIPFTVAAPIQFTVAVSI